MEGIEHLTAAVDQLLGADPDLLTDAELHTLVVGLQRERARLGAVAASAQAHWAARRIWAADGSKSAAARLGRDSRCSERSARIDLRRARQLRHMPCVRAALEAGEISLDHVDLLGRLRGRAPLDAFARDEQVLVDICRRLRFADAVRAVEYWYQRADPDGAAGNDARRAEGAYLHVSPTLDGTVAIDGVLDPVRGEIVRNELDRLEHELYLADQRQGVERSGSQRRAAALAEMATRSATAPADGRRPKPLFTVLVGEEHLARLCELSSGTVISPESLAPWIDDALLESVIFGGRHTIISVSRRRTFTGALRRAIQVRDRRCTHPAGCDEPGDRCDVDHVVPVPAGGITSQFNGQLQCRPHNRRADLHDAGAGPWPHRSVDRLDLIRARLRWGEQRRPPPP